MNTTLLKFFAILATIFSQAQSFTTFPVRRQLSTLNLQLKASSSDRLESIKAGALSALIGGVSATPLNYASSLLTHSPNTLGQWEFDTDMSSLEAALFGIVYRYVVRETDKSNSMLQQGVLGAFIIVRTLPQIKVPSYCDSIPLQCKYFYVLDPDTSIALVAAGVTSVATFVPVWLVLEYVMNEKGWIKRFDSFNV